MTVHIIKLVVGVDTVNTLAQWQKIEYAHYKGQKTGIVRTRYTPKRSQEIIETGGSIYRVIAGRILCRQKIVGFDTDEDTKRGKHCLIVTDTEITLTYPRPHRPFQGWRYLNAKDAPEDMGTFKEGSKEQEPSLEAELKELGFI